MPSELEQYISDNSLRVRFVPTDTIVTCFHVPGSSSMLRIEV